MVSLRDPPVVKLLYVISLRRLLLAIVVEAQSALVFYNNAVQFGAFFQSMHLICVYDPEIFILILYSKH